MIIEIFGIITTVLAVIGVVANNRRLRVCFLIWMVSNLISAIIHAQGLIWSLMARDVIFIILAVEGWYKWGKKE